MVKIVAITNQKGGVGKTTTAINLSAALASIHKKVFLIDLDPQGNATMGSGVDKGNLVSSTMEVILGDILISDAILHTPGNYDLLPANENLTIAEVSLLERVDREAFLFKALSKLESHYDFILLDCPPALNILTVNALFAAHSVLIPMQCEYYALEGLSGLLNTLHQMSSSVNSLLKIEGILRTMYDPRNRLSLEVSQQLVTHFGNQLYNTVIPRNVRLAEAPSHGLPALLYDRRSPGAAAYLALAEEFLCNQQKESHPFSIEKR